MVIKNTKKSTKVKNLLNPTSSQTTTREKKKNNMKQGEKTSSRGKHKSEKAKEEDNLTGRIKEKSNINTAGSKEEVEDRK